MLVLLGGPVLAATDSLKARFHGLDSFTAEFTQTLFDANQEKQEEVKGILRVQRPDRFNLEYTEPYYQLYVADGKHLYFYDQDLEQVTIKPQQAMLDNSPAMILSNPERLDVLYTVTPQGQDEGLFWYHAAGTARLSPQSRSRSQTVPVHATRGRGRDPRRIMNDSGDLFGTASPATREPDPAGRPLADRMRPRRLDEIAGQAHLLAPGKPLRTAIESGRLHSMVFWGPPGTGKTTLARIIARYCDAEFLSLSAVLSGVKDIRAAVDQARSLREASGRATVLFVDEVHRFNKSQQDAFLPFVEDGTVTFIGATTENPSFELNNALLSRARVYVLKALGEADILAIIDRALSDAERGLGDRNIEPGPDWHRWPMAMPAGRSICWRSPPIWARRPTASRASRPRPWKRC